MFEGVWSSLGSKTLLTKLRQTSPPFALHSSSPHLQALDDAMTSVPRDPGLLQQACVTASGCYNIATGTVMKAACLERPMQPIRIRLDPIARHTLTITCGSKQSVRGDHHQACPSSAVKSCHASSRREAKVVIGKAGEEVPGRIIGRGAAWSPT